MTYKPFESQCHVCGCTDSHGCADGCYWINDEETLCSHCAQTTAMVLCNACGFEPMSKSQLEPGHFRWEDYLEVVEKSLFSKQIDDSIRWNIPVFCTPGSGMSFFYQDGKSLVINVGPEYLDKPISRNNDNRT